MIDRPESVQRLKASLPGTNLELTGDYNQRLVYQAVRTGGPITRNALTEQTGLAKPTIASIVRRLVSSGLVLETSRIYGARGQPAVHLEIDPDGCYAIGLHIDADQLALIVLNACGTVVGRVSTELPMTADTEVNNFIRRQFIELTRNGRRDRVIGLGVATEASVGTSEESASPDCNGIGIDLLSLSELAPGMPIYIDTNLSAATTGESLFGAGAAFQCYYYVLLNKRPVGGLVLNQALHKGGEKPLFPKSPSGWHRDLTAIGHSKASEGDLSWTDAARLAAACDDLVPLLISINCVLNPGAVLIGGRVPARVLAKLAEDCNTALLQRAPEMPTHAVVRPAQLGEDAALIGAASLPMRARLFPTGETLLKTHDYAR